MTSSVVPAASLMKANLAKPMSVGSTMNSTPLSRSPGDCRLKVVYGQADVVAHPGVDLLRDRQRQAVHLQADNRDATKLQLLDFFGAQGALVEGDGLWHVVNNQMAMVKTVCDLLCGHLFLLFSAVLAHRKSPSVPLW